MAESIISEVVSDIVKKLGSKAYKDILFAKDLDSHIKRLKELKTTIEATILDAMSLESCTNAQKDVIEKLDCALADLDNFLGVKAAKSKQKEVMEGNKLIKEVRLFFSKRNQLVSSFKDSHEIKAIIERFEAISRDQAMVRDIISLPSVNNKTQVVSSGSLWSNCQILTEVVVGRDKDRDEIVNMLLDDSLSSQPLSVVSIVGIGGQGKTTLAKYVYHDNRVKSRFDVHRWVSTTPDFDVLKILINILATFKVQVNDNCDLTQLYNCFRQVISGKKFLLVLDNVWDHERLGQNWHDLKILLALGADGSKVLLTTRDKKVARIMDCVNPFVLGDLNEEDSWLLFKKIAFAQSQNPNLEIIGKEIVKMCPNVPLAIRSIGGLLATKCTEDEWSTFRDNQLANFSAYGRDIMHTLKLSYDHLDERLKLCVAYCSLFPKGYKFDDNINHIWICLGYIEPSYERQSLEEAANECLMMLERQGFITYDGWYMPLKIHDLMHDLLTSIVGFKYKIVVDNVCDIDERVRHLSIHADRRQLEFMGSSIVKLKQLQSFLILCDRGQLSNINVTRKIFYMFKSLRILSVSRLGIKKVPSSLGDLITLRYLDLSRNPITHLPNSITQLVELLSLDVSHCTSLEELPKGIKKLVKLRHIKNFCCPALFPKGVASLADLQTLDECHLEFKEGFLRESGCGLEEWIIIINRLVGRMKFYIKGDVFCKSFNAKEKECQIRCNLEELELRFQDGSAKGDEMVLGKLQPSTSLKLIRIYEYKGERLPRWIDFGNLGYIYLHGLEGCRSIGSFGRLLHLETLKCEHSESVEYIEEYSCEGTTPNSPLFPSLIELVLYEMPKLKKWYKEKEEDSSDQHNHNILIAPHLGFPKLYEMKVDNMEFCVSMLREFRDFSSLEYLIVCDCEDVKAIPNEISNLSNLRQLCLHCCSEELKERCRSEPILGEDFPLVADQGFYLRFKKKDCH